MRLYQVIVTLGYESHDEYIAMRRATYVVKASSVENAVHRAHELASDDVADEWSGWYRVESVDGWPYVYSL